MKDFILVDGKWKAVEAVNGVIFGNDTFFEYYEHNIDMIMKYYPSYTKCHDVFSEGRLTIKGINDKWGVMDKNGKIIVPCIYNEVDDYVNGIVIAFDHYFGVLDHNGDQIIPFEYDDISYYGNNNEFLLLAKFGQDVDLVKIEDLIGKFSYKEEGNKEVTIGGEKYISYDNMIVDLSDEYLVLYQVDTGKKIVLFNDRYKNIYSMFKANDEEVNDVKLFDLGRMMSKDIDRLVSFDMCSIEKGLKKMRGKN